MAHRHKIGNLYPWRTHNACKLAGYVGFIRVILPWVLSMKNSPVISNYTLTVVDCLAWLPYLLTYCFYVYLCSNQQYPAVDPGPREQQCRNDARGWFHGTCHPYTTLVMLGTSVPDPVQAGHAACVVIQHIQVHTSAAVRTSRSWDEDCGCGVRSTDWAAERYTA